MTARAETINWQERPHRGWARQAADLHVGAAGPMARRGRAVSARPRSQRPFAPTHAHGKLVAAGQSLKPGTVRAGAAYRW